MNVKDALFNLDGLILLNPFRSNLQQELLDGQLHRYRKMIRRKFSIIGIRQHSPFAGLEMGAHKYMINYIIPDAIMPKTVETSVGLMHRLGKSMAVVQDP